MVPQPVNVLDHSRFGTTFLIYSNIVLSHTGVAQMHSVQNAWSWFSKLNHAVFNKVAVFKCLIQQELHNALYYEEVQ